MHSFFNSRGEIFLLNQKTTFQKIKSYVIKNDCISKVTIIEEAIIVIEIIITIDTTEDPRDRVAGIPHGLEVGTETDGTTEDPRWVVPEIGETEVTAEIEAAEIRTVKEIITIEIVINQAAVQEEIGHLVVGDKIRPIGATNPGEDKVHGVKVVGAVRVVRTSGNTVAEVRDMEIIRIGIITDSIPRIGVLKVKRIQSVMHRDQTPINMVSTLSRNGRNMHNSMPNKDKIQLGLQ
jgi:hypothetical protein